jgi:3',5'-cyclic AMP phosphodiesterase CpdA
MLIAQLTDLHLRPCGLAANRVVESNTLVERAFARLAALHPAPDILILSGDLTHCGEPDAYQLLAELLDRYIRMPVFIIPGNHDDRLAMREILGDRLAYAERGPFIHGVVDDFPVRLVLLDSVVPGAPHGALCADRLAFLDAALRAAPNRPTAIILHHPPIDCGIAHMDGMKLRDDEAFAAIVGRHAQVRAIWCGHVHRAVTGMCAGVPVSLAPSLVDSVVFDLAPTAPSALVLEPSMFLLHRWSQAAGFVTHTVFVEHFPGPFPYLPG